MRIDSPSMTNAVITGSFSGSFTGTGNFVGLEADSVEYANVLNKPTLVSGSVQVDITATTGYTAFSSSIASDIAGLDSGYATDAELSAVSSSAASDIALNLSNISALQSNSATKVELNTSSSDLTTAYRSELNASSSALISAYGSADTALSSSLAADIASNLSSINSIGSFTASLDTDLTTLSLPANTTISTFGASLVDDADASAARTTLGVDAAGTDNSTDVTLVTTSHDYLSIAGQAITLGTIDISDDTNLTVSDTTGQTGINLTLTGDTISGVVSGLGTSANPTFNNLTLDGDLVVNGTTTTVNTQTLSVEDNMIYLNSGSAVTNPDLGFAGNYNDGTYAHAGLFSDASDSHTFKFFKGYTPEPDAASTIDTGHASFAFADLEVAGITANGNITVTGTVDGRDVAADGTKLDGIESSAKDDQTITAGNGLTGGGTGDVTLNVAGTTNRISVTADAVDIASTYAGQTSITTLGTIGTGTWQGSSISTTYTDAKVTSIVAGSGISINSGTGAVTVTNTITNNNQLTNGAGYTTYTSNQATNNNSNVHFEGLMVGQTTGATANTIRCVGDVVAYYSSDAQFKDNVVQLEGALDKVKQIRGVEFDCNDKQDVHTGHDIGVIAQEVEAVYPELVHHREHNDSKAVDYVKLTAVLIEAVKELAAKVEELEKK